MDIKLIALDLDGTTLGQRGISDETVRVLESAIEHGVHVVIATGRTFTALPEDIYRIGRLEYVISSNGAHITYLPENRTIYSNCIGSSYALAVCDVLERNSSYPIEVFTGGKAYIDEEIFRDIEANGSDFMSAEYILKTRKPVPRIYDFLRDNSEEIENINIHFRFQQDKKDFFSLLDGMEGITVTSSFISNIEIGGETTSKATAIRELCGRLCISEENVMACGDSPNDMTMITMAGLGVAMGNAEAEVKEAADFVTLSNLEDGVAHAVRRFVLKNL